jgi:hypothetical protein
MSGPAEWFGRPLPDLQDADIVRWRIVQNAARRLLAPKKKES